MSVYTQMAGAGYGSIHYLGGYDHTLLHFVGGYSHTLLHFEGGYGHSLLQSKYLLYLTGKADRFPSLCHDLIYYLKYQFVG